MESLTRMVLEDPAPLPPEELRLLLSRVVQSAGKLGDRMDGLLSFIRVSHQPLTRQRVNIQAVVGEILAESRKKADAPRVEILMGELPEVMGDPELVRQVFVNTLSNAFKFLRHTLHPRIEISARRLENQTAYLVADNGAGFDMKYADKLFSLFHRLHSEAEFEGAGVSLALTRRIIERHGGTIWAEAKKGHGATFRFTLPR
jgi:light-regulated signal transduction histidine kinase (bacteriophytochrome)